MIVMNMETCVNVRKYLNRSGLRTLLIFQKRNWKMIMGLLLYVVLDGRSMSDIELVNSLAWTICY